MNDDGERRPRVIRRYANRKLYDASESRYITLQDVEALVQGGVEVRVVDNRSGEDVTQAALAQILAGAGRRGDPRYSLSGILSLFGRPGLEKVQASREEAERFVRDVVGGLGRGLEDLQRRVDERVRHVVNEIDPLRRLSAEVRALGERLAAVERALGARRAKRKSKRAGRRES